MWVGGALCLSLCSSSVFGVGRRSSASLVVGLIVGCRLHMSGFSLVASLDRSSACFLARLIDRHRSSLLVIVRQVSLSGFVVGCRNRSCGLGGALVVVVLLSGWVHGVGGLVGVDR